MNLRISNVLKPSTLTRSEFCGPHASRFNPCFGGKVSHGCFKPAGVILNNPILKDIGNIENHFSPLFTVRTYATDAGSEKRHHQHKPWMQFSDLINEIQDTFSRDPFAYRREFCWPRGEFHATTKDSEWRPRADIAQEKDAFVIHTELPGVKKEDIKVNLEDGVLTISGQRKSEINSEDVDTKLFRQERRFGNFSRSFDLPEDVNPSQIKAAFKDGVLEIRIAKVTKEKPQSVEVKIDS